MIQKMKNEIGYFNTIWRIDSRIAKAEGILSSVLMLSMIAMLLIQVTCRYYFYIPVPWAEELARFIWVGIIFVGGSYVTFTDDHIEINIIDTILGKFHNESKKRKISQIIFVVKYFFTLLLVGIFIYNLYPMMLKVCDIGQISSSAHLPMWTIYLVILLGLIGMALHCIIKIFSGIAAYDDYCIFGGEQV